MRDKRKALESWMNNRAQVLSGVKDRRYGPATIATKVYWIRGSAKGGRWWAAN